MLNNSVYYEDIFTSFDEAEAKEIERLKGEGWTVAAEIVNVSPSIRYCTVKRHDRTPTVSAIANLGKLKKIIRYAIKKEKNNLK